MSATKLRLVCLALGTAMLLTAIPLGALGDDDATVAVIILFKDKVDKDVVKDYGGTVDLTYSIIPAVVAVVKEKDVKKLEKNDKVKSVSENTLFYAVGEVDTDGKGGGKPAPNPVPQSLGWGVDRIDADLAWGTTTGSTIDVAIVDTGIDNDHPDLPTIGKSINYVSQRGTINNDAWDDDNGHGTHCAGIVAAQNNAIGYIGVAPGVTLHAVKVLNKQGSGWVSDIILGLQWCAGNDIEVISMSLSSKSDAPGFHAACDAAQAAGMVLVAAAGNSGSSTPEYPAAYDSVISIGATDKSDSLAYFSNYGDEMDLVAPGVSIPSTYKGGTYKTLSGTSMACPHVAGTAALVLTTDITDTSYDSDHDDAWDPAEVMTCLVDTAESLVGVAYGLVDAEAAV